MNKIIILNAPPQCGKDTIADLLQHENLHLRRASFKWPLFDIFVNTTGMQMEEFLTLYELKGWKDTPNDALNGHTPRELLIHISENFIKPFYGKKYFGDWIADFIHLHELQAEAEMEWVIPDGGFNEEIEVLADRFPGRILVVQIEREGYRDFGNDSRNWISNGLTERGVSFIHADTTDGNSKLVDLLKSKFELK